jgi:hypothetical protein
MSWLRAPAELAGRAREFFAEELSREEQEEREDWLKMSLETLGRDRPTPVGQPRGATQCRSRRSARKELG